MQENKRFLEEWPHLQAVIEKVFLNPLGSGAIGLAKDLSTIMATTRPSARWPGPNPGTFDWGLP